MFNIQVFSSFNFKFQYQVSISNFNIKFQYQVSISSFNVKFQFQIPFSSSNSNLTRLWTPTYDLSNFHWSICMCTLIQKLFNFDLSLDLFMERLLMVTIAFPVISHSSCGKTISATIRNNMELRGNINVHIAIIVQSVITTSKGMFERNIRATTLLNVCCK